MDLSKVFDCADHEILLTKFSRFGGLSIPLRWISSYISSIWWLESLRILESDPINIIKFKYRCSTGINSWSHSLSNLHLRYCERE